MFFFEIVNTGPLILILKGKFSKVINTSLMLYFNFIFYQTNCDFFHRKFILNKSFIQGLRYAICHSILFWGGLYFFITAIEAYTII